VVVRDATIAEHLVMFRVVEPKAGRTRVSAERDPARHDDPEVSREQEDRQAGGLQSSVDGHQHHEEAGLPLEQPRSVHL
jgi:hypothetical protein